MKKLRLLTVLVAAAMILTVIAGCQPAESSTSGTSTTTEGTTTGGSTEPAEIQLPLTDTPVTFEMFMPINRAEQDYSDNEIWAKISEMTGIEFEFVCPLSENASDNLSLLLSSQQYPDTILTASGSGATYPGGLEVGVDDGVLLDLKALAQEYAPLYWDRLVSNESALRDAITDKGYLAAIYEVSDKDTNVNPGIWCNVTRQDWLDDLELEVPNTMDEWYTALTGFKEDKGATFPLLWMLGKNPIWAQAYGISAFPISASGAGSNLQFYPDENGVIHYGGYEQGWEDYLVMLSQWYEEGLFDRDFTTRDVFDLPTAATLFATGEAGVTGGYLAWTGMYMGQVPEEDKDSFEIAVCPAPVLEEGQKGVFVSTKPEYLGFNQLSITSQCENPELFMQLINWMSSEEGYMLTNYGIEGTHYTMVDGAPTFTDVILENEAGPFDAREIIIGHFSPVRLVETENMMTQLYSESTLAAAQIPSDSTDTLYLVYKLSEDEAYELSDIFNDIHTYVAEQYELAVMNPEIAANWMEVQAVTIEELGIERAIEICQGAYDRYMAKGA